MTRRICTLFYGIVTFATNTNGVVTASLTSREEQFLRIPSSQSARESLRYVTSKPHVAGTTGDYEMAEYVQEWFREAGIPDVSLFELTALLNYPNSKPTVTMIDATTEKVLYEAALTEKILAQDDTSDTIWRNHTFHGYSPSGNIRSSVVYANYGRPQDFEALTKAGVSLEGTIVMVRYGKCFRGLKVRNAQLAGAAGVIIYSDPADDGYHVGPVYPDGPWRPEFGIQRGSVQFNSKCAGDPMRADARYNDSTAELCGVDSYRDLIPSIPSLPMSYGDAKLILKNLGGPTCEEIASDFCGGLSIQYTVGPSTPENQDGNGIVVQMNVDNKEAVRKIPNVIGKIPGILSPSKDMPVLLGNHRDAWVFGAADPNSGTSTLMEVARGLGHLWKEGWRPERSIYLLSWSGEEYGLLGSTGWGELNAVPHLERALAYLNSDTTVSGSYLMASASPSLSTLWKSVLMDAQGHITEFSNGPMGEIRDANTDWLLDEPENNIGLLGSGSDYTVFLDHLGIPSLDFSFSKANATYGQYHSIYDSFAWVDKFGGIDGSVGSSFELMVDAAKIWGLMAIRLATSKIVPIDPLVQADALVHYTSAIEEQKCGLDLDDLKQAVSNFQQAAAQLSVQCSSGIDSYVESCNEKLGLVERQFLSQEGLPGRKWFKHILQAPGLDLGYAAEAFPGIQQAIDGGNLTLGQEQVSVVVVCILSAVDLLKPTEQ